MKVIQLHNAQQQKLVERAAKKDRQAQHELYEMHAPKLLSVIRMYVKDRQFAEDVLVEAFIKIFKKIPDFQNKGSFEGWMRRIAVNQAIDFLRSEKTKLKCTQLREEFCKSPEGPQKNESANYIQSKLDELPEGYKMVFTLYAIEGFKHKEIAAKLKISTGTSKSQLAKARKMLQEKLKEDYEAGSIW